MKRPKNITEEIIAIAKQLQQYQWERGKVRVSSDARVLSQWQLLSELKVFVESEKQPENLVGLYFNVKSAVSLSDEKSQDLEERMEKIVTSSLRSCDCVASFGRYKLAASVAETPEELARDPQKRIVHALEVCCRPVIGAEGTLESNVVHWQVGKSASEFDRTDNFHPIK